MHLFDTSFQTLKILAALVWYIGGVVLLYKGLGQLERALDLRPGFTFPALAAATGVLIGVLKGRLVFGHACRKNLARITTLPRPRLWQFYRPRFFLFMFTMIMLGRYLSSSAQGLYGGLLAMAILELSLAVALLGSSYIFWLQADLPEKETPE